MVVTELGALVIASIIVGLVLLAALIAGVFWIVEQLGEERREVERRAQALAESDRAEGV